MYDQLMKNFQEQMAPLNTIVDINKKTVEKLIDVQSSYVTELVTAGFAQLKALTEVKDPKAAFDLQVVFYKEMEAKLTSVAETELATISAAREELTSVVEESVKTLAETDYLKEVSNFDISKFMPEVAAPKKAAAKSTRKAAAPKATA
jgi:hypothetical protein